MKLYGMAEDMVTACEFQAYPDASIAFPIVRQNVRFP